MITPPPRSTLFPYTTLFRSNYSEENVNAATASLLACGTTKEEVAAGLIAALKNDTDVIRRNAINALRSEEHTSELQSHSDLVCRLLLEKKKEDRSKQQ